MDAPFAMLQDAALLRILHTPGAGLQTLAVYHMVSRSRTLREQGERVSNAAIGRALGISRTRVSEAMTWLRDHGLIDEDEHGLQAVVLDPINLRESVRSTGRSEPETVRSSVRNGARASAQPDGAAPKASGTPDGLQESVRSTGRSDVHEPSAQPDGAPYIERDPCTDSSSSARDAADLPSSEPVADEEGESLGVDLDLWRRRVESGDIAVGAFDADPSSPWLEFEHKPAEAVLERFRQLGMRSERRSVPSFEGGKPQHVVRWRPSSAQAYRALPAMLEAIRDLFDPDPQDPIAAPEPPPAPAPAVAVSAEPTDEQAAAAWEPIAAAFRGLDSHVDRAVPVSVDADVLSIRAADEMGALVLSKRAAELAERAHLAAIRVLPPAAQGAA